ncbi:response regulator transcription factor [Paenibacillus sp.]|uniref:response regulator transcription factor n=1 Tax=Paenibacillus sp. TaxID=58172 RepID=UPI00281177AF|nr:response regulator transcription factor [Paenibacillus sp.]
MHGKGRIRILLADAHPLFRDGLAAALRLHDDAAEIVGQAGYAAEAVRKAIELQPDVVLMDVQLGETSGIEAARDIVEACPHIHILMVTNSDDDDAVMAAIRAGARGYLLKGSDKQVLLRAIAAVASGEAIFGAAIARKLALYFDSMKATKKPMLEEAFPSLTEREQDILELICSGLPNEEIARRINVSIKTVRNHVSNVLNKLQAEDRAQAIALVKEAGFRSSFA